MSGLREKLNNKGTVTPDGREVVTINAALATFREWLAENGLVVVPREATGDMVIAAFDYRFATMNATSGDIYAVMIAAAPDALKATDPAP